MAENEEKNLEKVSKYTVLLQELDLFSSAEISRLTKKIEQYDSLLASDTQLLENYRKIIELEIGLIKEIKRRKREKEVTNSTKGECYFVHKVMGHYQKGLKYFPDNYDFHLEYFNFIKLFPEHQNVTGWLIKDLLATFGGKKPEVFRKAASFYFNSNKHEEARKILLSGQSKYPQELDIYLDLIELELRSKDKTGSSERLKQYIDFMAENKLRRKFIEETILVIDSQLNLRHIAEYALDKLLSTFEDVESYLFAATWELKADQSQSKMEDQPYSAEAVEKSIRRLKQGIFALHADKKPDMWKCYINFTKKLFKTDRKLKNFLVRALQEAENSRIKLSEEHFLDWVACHKTNKSLVLAKVEKAVQAYPNSDLVRVVYLKYLMMAGSWARASVEFNKALDALGSNTLRIWEAYLTGLAITNCQDDVKALFEKGVKYRHPNVAVVMKAKYCVWTSVNCGLKLARELYFKLATTQPYSNELHREMFRIERINVQELSDERRNLDVLNSVLSLWQEQFGKTEKDVYLHRVEILHEQMASDWQTKIQEVYRQAVTKLKDPEAVAGFKASFESYQKKLWKTSSTTSDLESPDTPDADSSSLTDES